MFYEYGEFEKGKEKGGDFYLVFVLRIVKESLMKWDPSMRFCFIKKKKSVNDCKVRIIYVELMNSVMICYNFEVF